MNRILPLPEKRQPHKFILPDIPRQEWCDYRREYEAGLSLRAIAERHFVDPRTVRSGLVHNIGSDGLGRRHAPRKLSIYENQIRTMLPALSEKTDSLIEISRQITSHLKEIGYTGSERTVRNFIRSVLYADRNQTALKRDAESV